MRLSLMMIRIQMQCHTHSRGVARVINMCTHNDRGTDLRSFSETGRGLLFLIHDCHLMGEPPYRCAQLSGHDGGPGAAPGKNLQSRPCK